jgi:hypothetical protein
MSNNQFAIAEVLPGKLNALVKNLMKATGIDDPNEAVRAINNGEFVIMKIDGTMFNASKYFVTRQGLWVSSDFTSRILPAYINPMTKRGLDGVNSVDLPRNMYDSEIITEYLGGEEQARKNAFTLDQIAELVDGQRNGEAGVLLNNGYANIFYVVGKDGVLFAVPVRWRSPDRQWRVDAYELDGHGDWIAGSRLFRNKN